MTPSRSSKCKAHNGQAQEGSWAATRAQQRRSREQSRKPSATARPLQPHSNRPSMLRPFGQPSSESSRRPTRAPGSYSPTNTPAPELCLEPVETRCPRPPERAPCRDGTGGGHEEGGGRGLLNPMQRREEERLGNEASAGAIAKVVWLSSPC